MKLKALVWIVLIIIGFYQSIFALNSLKCIAEFKPFDLSDSEQIELGKGNGDLNGDGFKDIVIAKGMYDHDPEIEMGEIKIYFGSTNFDTIPDITITEESLGFENWIGLGTDLAYNGDINGDGYDDLAISASECDPERSGCVFVWLGGAEFDTEVDYTFSGMQYGYDAWGLNYGFRVDIGGDYNNDGYNDLTIGAPGHFSGNMKGQVDVFFGGEVLSSSPEFHLVGQPGQCVGEDIVASDFNGDGYDDLFVQFGENGEVLTEFNQGIYVYSGGKEMNTTPVQVFNNTYRKGNHPFFGDGDFNGDGYDDIFHFNVIDLETNFYGAMLWGNPQFELDYDFQLTETGYGVSTISKNIYININGDKYDDIIFCRSYLYNDAKIYFGSAEPDSVADIFFQLPVGKQVMNKLIMAEI